MKNGFRGFITVEVTLIIPILVGCVFTMITMALYLYNSCLLQQNSYMVAVQVRNQSENQPSIEYQEIYNNLYHQKYLLAYGMEMEMRMTQGNIFVESNAKVVSLGIEHFFLQDENFLVHANTVIGNRNNYLILYTLKKLKDVAQLEEEND